MSEARVKELLGLHADKNIDEEVVAVDDEEGLEHHGVKGQKWGVRRATRQGQSLARAKRVHDNAAAKGGAARSLHENRAKAAEKSLNKVNKRIEKKGGTPVPVPGRRAAGATKKSDKRTHFDKPAKKLSDKDLQDRIKRMELEKKYNELNARPPSKGKKFTEDLMTNTGKQVATTLLTGTALFLVGRAIEKKFGEGAQKPFTGRDTKTAVKNIAEATGSFS